jgi:hypothetical protein
MALRIAKVGARSNRMARIKATGARLAGSWVSPRGFMAAETLNPTQRSVAYHYTD